MPSASPSARAWSTCPLRGWPRSTSCKATTSASRASSVPVGAGRLTLAATHLTYVPGPNLTQLRVLQDRAAGRPAPRVLLGDLNLWLPVVRLASRPGWQPLLRGRTFPNLPPGQLWPAVQLDHVLLDDAEASLRVRRTRIVASLASDHRAALVDLEWPEPAPARATRQGQT